MIYSNKDDSFEKLFYMIMMMILLLLFTSASDHLKFISWNTPEASETWTAVKRISVLLCLCTSVILNLTDRRDHLGTHVVLYLKLSGNHMYQWKCDFFFFT